MEESDPPPQFVLNANDGDSRSRYVVKPGVFFTAVDGEGVLMDLESDRYLGLTALSAYTWQSFEGGLSIEAVAERISERGLVQAHDAPKVVDDQLRAWALAGIIVLPADAENMDGWRIRPKARHGRLTFAAPETQEGSFAACLLAAFELARAVVWTRWLLRRRGLLGTILHLQSLPVRDTPHNDVGRQADALISSHSWMRRLIWRGDQDCLKRSLTLAAALRRRGIDADLCFGVKKFPFLAHAWVEVSGLTLDETLSTSFLNYGDVFCGHAAGRAISTEVASFASNRCKSARVNVHRKGFAMP